LWHKADNPTAPAFVRYWSNSGHWSALALNGLVANDPYLPFTLHSIVASARDNRGAGKEAVDQTIREATMKTQYVVALSLLTGVAIGGAAIQGLHAQAKPKAYRVSESEVLDAAATTAYNPALQAAQKAAGGRSFRTTGRIIAVVGTAPKRVSISEWDSLEQAQAWQNSEARKNLEPQRGKAIKIIRQYIVESAN